MIVPPKNEEMMTTSSQTVSVSGSQLDNMVAIHNDMSKAFAKVKITSPDNLDQEQIESIVNIAYEHARWAHGYQSYNPVKALDRLINQKISFEVISDGPENIRFPRPQPWCLEAAL